MSTHEPIDTDLFLVDLRRGTHYHVKGCMTTTGPSAPPGAYVELPYAKIRGLKTHSGGQFVPDICVPYARRRGSLK